MNMQPIDWGIVIALIVFMTGMAFYTKKYTRSVADFLAANRCANRYLLAVSENMAMMGAISIVAQYELFYYGGLGAAWWQMLIMPVGMILGLLGWVIYRYRETRAMTLAQFFEIRYTRNFRRFAGILIFVSGVLNFGIFPAVGARFFIYFMGLEPAIQIWSIELSTYATVMGILLVISLLFTLMGGQIAVMVTDFIQGAFCNIIFAVVTVYLLLHFTWPEITESLLAAPEGKSMVNPFKGQDIESFNIWFFLIMVFAQIYNSMAWQGTQGYNCAATSPHEAKMGKIMGGWRQITQISLWVLIPIIAYTVMHSPEHSDKAAIVNETLNKIDVEAVQKQMLVPTAMSTFLPVGLFGAMTAVMFAAFIGNHDTYLHSWASIFIQDVVLPFRQKPFSPKTHMRLLRLSTIGVAFFIYLWSLLFRQTDFILMYFAMTGALYLGGAGSVIIGGLYWKKGTTQAAYSSLIVGSVLAISGLIVRQVNPQFMMNGQEIFFVAMLSSLIVYIMVSLITCKQPYNLDKMLHRGKYERPEDKVHKEIDPEKIPAKSKFWQKIFARLGLTTEFSFKDKIVFGASVIWSIGWSLVCIIGIVYNYMVGDINDDFWVKFWYIWLLILVGMSMIITIWLVIGGIIDMKKMFVLLNTQQRNELDDGMVIDHKNLDESLNDN